MKTMLRLRISALFCIALVLLLPAALAQSLNPTQDPPFIDLILPSYIADNKIDIVGATEPGAVIELWVNNDLVRKKTTTDGNINWIEIELLANEKNTILVRSIKNAVANQKQFEITSDMIPPEINLKEIPAATMAKQVTLEGSASETCNLSIKVNDIEIYSAETTNFNIAANLEEGNNNIVITAIDKARNEVSLEKTILSDSIPPLIENINPKPGSFYYQDRAIDDIAGSTEPFAEVRLYYEFPAVAEEDVERVQILKETANENGYFEFKNVNFEHPKPDITLRRVEAGAVVSTQEIQKSQPVTFIIEAEDVAGWKTEEKVTYSIGTCWAGELDFDINPMLEYQYPTLLSPERLNEGTEIISFVLAINYTGNAKDWNIQNIEIESACGRSGGELAEKYKGDLRYEISCDLLGRLGRPSIKDHNRAKTLWYIQYKNLRTSEFTNFSEDFWKSFVDTELIFPLKITVKYSEKDTVYEEQPDGRTVPIEKMVSKVQVNCISMGYFVDVPIDPRKILPDWLLEDGMEFANNTINEIDKVLPELDKAIVATGMTCIGAWVSRLAAKWIRVVVCKLESQAGKTLKKSGDSKYCPSEKKSEDEPKGRLELSEKELGERCSACSAMWDFEAALYQVYRFSCDRVFCHTAPAGWTEEATDAQIFQAEAKARFCGIEDISGIKPLEHIKNCAQEHAKDLDDPYKKESDCYSLNGVLYVWDKKDPTAEGVYTLKLASKVSGVLGVKKPDSVIKVIKPEGSQTYATALAFSSCTELCQRFNKNYKGKCVDPEKCVSEPTEGFVAGYVAGKDGKDACWVEKDLKQQCCCYIDEEPEKIKGTKGDQKDWNYRDQQLYRETNAEYGKYFPQDRYISGRDMPACFGMDHLFDYTRTMDNKAVPMVDPYKQNIAAFQCLCLTSIRNRVMIVKNIMVGVRNCLKEVQLTGAADAGVCKEVFTIYICDWAYRVFLWFKEGCIPIPFTSGVRIHGGAEADVEEPIPVPLLGVVFGSVGDLWDVVKGAGADLEAEYGETQLSNYLEGGEKAISRKICLGALGFDVGLDFQSLVDMTYTSQFKTSILGFGRRDFVTYNPATSLATYSYRGAWTMFTGCRIKSYSVDLVCVNLEEQSRYNGIDCARVNDVQHGTGNIPGCNCLYSNEGYSARSRKFYSSMTTIEPDQFIDQDYHEVITADRRYDHIRMRLVLDDGQDPAKCFPEGHEDGVFFFPVVDRTAEDILDCYVDERGLIKCTRGLEWEELGEAWFEPYSAAECGLVGRECYMLCKDPLDKKYKSCSLVKYQIGEKIEVKVRVAGKKKQCIYAYAETATGEKITGRKEWFQVGSIGIEEEYTSEPNLDLGTTYARYFGEALLGKARLELLNATSCKSAYKIAAGKEESRIAGIATIRFNKTGNEFNITTGGSVKVYTDTNKNDLIAISDLQTKSYSAEDIKKMLFVVNGPAIQFTSVNEGKCEFKAVPIGAVQDWKLHAELRYTDVDGQCDDNAIDTISIVGKETVLEQSIEVNEIRERAAEEAAIVPAEEIETLPVEEGLGCCICGDDPITQIIVENVTREDCPFMDIYGQECRWQEGPCPFAPTVITPETPTPEIIEKISSSFSCSTAMDMIPVILQRSASDWEKIFSAIEEKCEVPEPVEPLYEEEFSPGYEEPGSCCICSEPEIAFLPEQRRYSISLVQKDECSQICAEEGYASGRYVGCQCSILDEDMLVDSKIVVSYMRRDEYYYYYTSDDCGDNFYFVTENINTGEKKVSGQIRSRQFIIDFLERAGRVEDFKRLDDSIGQCWAAKGLSLIDVRFTNCPATQDVSTGLQLEVDVNSRYNIRSWQLSMSSFDGDPFNLALEHGSGMPTEIPVHSVSEGIATYTLKVVDEQGNKASADCKVTWIIPVAEITGFKIYNSNGIEDYELEEYEPFSIDVSAAEVAENMDVLYLINQTTEPYRSYSGEMYKGTSEGEFYYDFSDGRTAGDYAVKVWIKTPEKIIDTETKQLKILVMDCCLCTEPVIPWLSDRLLIPIKEEQIGICRDGSLCTQRGYGQSIYSDRPCREV